LPKTSLTRGFRMESLKGKSERSRAACVGNRRTTERYNTYNDPAPDYVWFTTTGLPLPTGEYSAVARRGYDQQVYGRVEEYRKSGWSNYNGTS
jgi:hypothetical protein